jgi:hypothetical protein
MGRTKTVSARVTFEQYDRLVAHAEAQGTYLAILMYEALGPLLSADPAEVYSAEDRAEYAAKSTMIRD